MAYQLITWEDFGIPADLAPLFAAIEDVHRRAALGEVVEIACVGGIGRTGTLLAYLAISCGLSASEALEFVRRHYHPYAVETPAQEDLIATFADTMSG